MLTLNDGRAELWQWDTNRKLTVDAECSQVHFSNKVFGRSVDVDVVDGVASIPDILLQTDKELTAWAFVGTAENGYTKISKTFKVNKRNKPADYVFTPHEQATLCELIERLDKIEESQDPDAIKNAVEDYLEQNPVDVPVESVNGKTGDVELTAEDVGAISQDDLQEATNEALAQAKASGEFDGPAGPPGPAGEDGKPGPAGADGAPGVSGVYVGSGEMPEGYNIQIDPDGDPFDGIIPPEVVQEIAEQAAKLVEVPSGGGIDVTGAEVGQIIKVAEVDENGRPIAWTPGSIAPPIPFAGTKLRLIVNQKITADAEGNKPSYLEITQRDDGTPLALKAFVIQTDIKSSWASYTNMMINDYAWDAAVRVPHGNNTAYPIYIVTEAETFVTLSTDCTYSPVGRDGDAFTGLTQVDKIIYPSKNLGPMHASSTFIKIWEIYVEE